MGRMRYNHNSFSIGFLSRKIQGNTDFEGYNNALSECVNFVIQPTGGLFKRTGTYFAAEAKSGSPRLVLFSYSAEDQYICEFGAGYIRYFTKYGILTDEHDAIVETVTTFTEDEVNSMTVQQDGNILILITSKGLYTLTRTAIDNFVLEEQEYSTEQLTFTNNEKVALKPSANTGVITITVVDPTDNSRKPDAKYAPFFNDDDIGHFITLSYRLPDADNIIGIQTYYLRITEIDNDTGGFKKVTATIDKDRSYNMQNTLPSVTAVTRWQLGAFTETRGTPKASAFYEGRLFLANNGTYPTGIWGSSKVYLDWTDFYTGTNDEDAVMFKMSAKNADEILWLASQSKLFVGTRWGIYVAGSATYNDEGITPSNFRIRLFEASGASDLQPVTGMDSVFFVDVSGKKVHEIHLSSETGAYQVDDISLLSDDLTQSGIIAHTWQQNPIQTYWCAVDDGYLCSLTYLKNNGIMAWSKHEIMGDNVKIEQLCTMHGDKNDLVWMVVRREINGEFKRYIEYMHAAYDPLQQEEFKQFYVDSGVTKQDKYTITNIERGNNPQLKIKITNTIATQIEALIPINNGMLEVAFIAVLKKFFLTKLSITEIETQKYLIGTLFDYYETDAGKIAGKIKVLDFEDYKDDLPDNFVYINVSQIFGLEGNDVRCDTRYLVNGDKVILFDSDIPDYTQSGQEYTISEKTATTVQIIKEDGSKIRPSSGKLFKQISQELEILNDAVDCTITLESAITDGAARVYINKVTGMTQINKTSYKVADISVDRKNIILYDEKVSELCGTDIPLDASDFSPFDTVNPNGNVYVYFSEMDGLDHLKGQTVDVCADGNQRDSRKVSDNGTITFDHPVMYCSAGLAVKSWLKTTPFSGGSLLGSSVGAVGGQKSMWLHLYYSLGGRYGSESSKTYPIPYLGLASNFNKPKSLVTGLIKCPITNSKDIYDRSIYIEHTEPVAFNILSITQDIEVSDS